MGLLAFSLGSLGCTPMTYRIERTALVPIVAPPFAPGAGTARTRLSAGYATPIVDPRSERDADQALYLPRHTGALEPTLAINRNVELRMPVEIAYAADAIRMRQADLGSPDASYGLGLGVAYHGDPDGHLYLDVGIDLLAFSIASRVRVSWDDCDDEYGDPYVIDFGPPCRGEEESEERSAVVGGRVFGSLGLQGRHGYGYVLFGARNQPSNDGSDTVVAYSEPEHDPEVTAGTLDAMIGVGGALRLGQSFEVGAQVWTAGGDGIVAYGPVVSVAVTGLLPDVVRATGRRAQNW